MNRKSFIKKMLLASAGTSLLTSSCQPAKDPSVASFTINNASSYRWKMVTTWPPHFPILGEAADLFASLINQMSNGRLQIKVYGSGELVPGLETFDAVSNGAVEMGSGAAYYWSGKLPMAPFFASVPFGMNASQLQSWLIAGGGMELYKKLYDRFDIIPFLAGNTGVQMGGWFNKEINNIEDLKGLKMRIPGIGGQVLERAGGAAVLVAGGEIYTSLERGVIDATEWVGPFHDYKMGFYKIAKYYYTPGWHEPGSQMEFLVNKDAYASLPKDLQLLIESVSYHIQTWMLSSFDAINGEYLDKLIKEEEISIRQFPKKVLDQLKIYSYDIWKELAAKDKLSKEIYESYTSFMNKFRPWSALTEQAYYDKIF